MQDALEAVGGKDMFKFAPLSAFMVALLICASAAPATTIYSGELTWELTESQIDAEAAWADPVTKVEWTVEKTGPVEWTYTYVFTVPTKEISHLIIEVSENLTSIDDIVSNVPLEASGIGLFDVDGPGESNPNIPDDLYGLKFDLAEVATSIEIGFTIDRDPIWGDFYAKDGKDDGVDVTAFNAGFTAGDTDPDPLVFGPDSDLVTDHILVPDTIPEPATLGLIVLGGAAMLVRFRRRFGAI
jgi:hypothetical protein